MADEIENETDTTETVDETFAGILDGEEETLRERLGTPEPEPEPEPDSISEDEAALRSRNQRAWMASEGHILHNRHDADEWERRGERLLAAINRHGIRVDMGTLHIGSMAAAVFELLQLKGLVTEHEARAAKNMAAHDGLAQILLRVEAEADQRKEQQRAAQSAPVVAQRSPIFVPGRDG